MDGDGILVDSALGGGVTPTLSLVEMLNMRMAPVVPIVNRLALRLPLGGLGV